MATVTTPAGTTPTGRPRPPRFRHRGASITSQTISKCRYRTVVVSTASAPAFRPSVSPHGGRTHNRLPTYVAPPHVRLTWAFLSCGTTIEWHDNSFDCSWDLHLFVLSALEVGTEPARGWRHRFAGRVEGAAGEGKARCWPRSSSWPPRAAPGPTPARLRAVGSHRLPSVHRVD